MTPKFTLVPSAYFSEGNARELLSKVVLLDDGEPLSFVDVPAYKAVLIYSGRRPEVYDMMMSLCKVNCYNKLIVALVDGFLHMVVAQGDDLVFCNCFNAPDQTTAEYYIFMTLKRLQINPEISTIYFYSAVPQDTIVSFCRYFKSAEALQ